MAEPKGQVREARVGHVVKMDINLETVGITRKGAKDMKKVKEKMMPREEKP